MDISADLLRDLYNKGEVSQYLCINKTISKSINLTIRLSKACNLLCKFCIQGKAYKKTYDETGHCNEVTYKVISDLNEGGFIANGKYCTAGVTTIRILPNGEVLRAGCNFCQNNYQLGNLLNDDIITLPKEPILCQLSKDKFCPLCYKVNTYE